MPITLNSYNLHEAEKRLCTEALQSAGNIIGAAALLGITRHALKRRILKLEINWRSAPEKAAA
ncbi:helix-turn-helix domain-containing protein [Nannocystis pusilla]|uniref:helix-turn-helix domain-containing protein n=1 Tax=Nannocystis pusilla TaxID=889268 RepID=UPI003B7999B8